LPLRPRHRPDKAPSFLLGRIMSGQSFHLRVWILAGVVCVLSSCSSSSTPNPAAATRPSGFAASSEKEISAGTAAPLNLAYDEPAVVGASVHATAASLPPGKEVEIMWGTVTGGWVIE